MAQFLDGLRCGLRSFGKARRGAIAALFAVLLVPVILATGAAVDFSRLAILKGSLQSVADGAAIAGASTLILSTGTTSAITVATDYFNKGAARISSNAVISAPTVSEPSSIEVTVVATATLKNTLMSLVSGSTQITVTASAEGPAYALTVTKTAGLTTSSSDSNSIYFYNASTSTTPAVSAMTLLFTNDSSVGTTSTSSRTVGVGANDYVGFALVNKTGGISPYGPNGYNSPQGTTQIFYSSLAVPSSSAYSAARQGKFYTGTSGALNTCSSTVITQTTTTHLANGNGVCGAHPCATLSNGSVLENNLLIGPGNSTSTSGSCSSQATATQTCLSLQTTPLTFTWNDMGGGSDDYDYNDAVYTVSCTPTTSTSSQPTAVILVQ